MNHAAKPPSFSEEILAHTVREAKVLAESHVKLASRIEDPAVRGCVDQLRSALEAYAAVTEGEFDRGRFGAALERLQASMDALRDAWSLHVRGRTA
ncbi:MAG TPA: hypothetical protein VF765_31375 [Polyangiaceae bacterium]